MRFKGTLVLLVVCLALAGFVYFYEIKGGQQREHAKEAENQLWKVESADVKQMSLDFAERHITLERDSEDAWKITAPRLLDADSEEIDRLASSAANMRRDSVVEAIAQNLTKFGLDPARARLSLKTGNDEEYRILFGSNNPTGNSVYARMPDRESVFLVPDSLVDTFDKEVDELRNHSVLSFDQSEVQSLSLKTSREELDLVKDNDDRWWIAGEEKLAADSPGVRGILTALSLARIEEFFNENPDDYRSLGLDRPLVEASLICGEDKAIKRLQVGTEKALMRKKRGAGTAQQDYGDASAAELFLAKDDSRDDLFFVEKELVDKLLQSRDDLRDMALSAFLRWDIDVIILKNSRGNFTITKSGGEWFLGDTKKKADWETVSGILDAMENRVQEILDRPGPLSNYGLQKPPIRVVLKKGSKPIVDATVARGVSGEVYARVKGDSSVKRADPEIFDKLDKGESDLIEAPEAQSETDTRED